MKRKREYGRICRVFGKLFLIALGASCLFLICRYSEKTEETYPYSEAYVRMDEIPLMLGGYYYTPEDWTAKIKEEKFKSPLLNSAGVKWILQQTGTAEQIPYDSGNGKHMVTRKEWNDIYDQIRDLLDDEETIQTADEVILHKKKQTITCAYKTYHTSLDLSFAKPMTAVSFYVQGEEIVGIRSLQSKEVYLKNVFITRAEKEQIHFLHQGEDYELTMELENPKEVTHQVCDLLWENGGIARVQLKEERITGNLNAVTEDSIEIEGYGQIHRSENLPVYKIYGTIEQKELSDIVIANMNVEYVVAEDRVEAVILKEPAQISRIRVLLLADDGEKFRSGVCVCANTAYQVTNKDQIMECSAEQTVKADELFGEAEETVIQLKPSAENGELFLCDENGTILTKGYQGVLELRRYPQGYTVVNELPVEQYLCAVVPSEMPASYETEALKAQAICARSYAYIQLKRADYAEFGAHVDDSTNYQVYNKKDREEKTTAAVLDTAGLVIEQGEQVAEAYYFSTSAGITNNGDSWHLTGQPSFAYLKSVQVKEGGGTPDLSEEGAFEKFLLEPDTSSYEASLPYFRWTARADYFSKTCRKKISSLLKARKQRTPEDIRYFDKNNNPTEKRKKFGALCGIHITARSPSGAALELELQYEKGRVLVSNEYNIRLILGAGIQSLTLGDNSEKADVTVLPSAFCCIIPVEDNTFVIRGGGYGHGIGMSQNGAAAMAAQGKTCEKILKFFFENIEIVPVS